MARILDMTAEYPTYSYVRVSQQLRLIGVPASAAQVRGVWAREGLLKRFDRLLWLERRVAERGGPLTESVLKLLRQHAHQTTDPQQTIEAPVPGFLGCQDTNYVGTLKGVGRGYAQTFIDANAAVGFAKLYLSKVPMTAVDLLHDRVLPFYESQGVPLQRVLTDNGRKYCGRPLRHPYELYCAVQQLEHRTTRIGSPESNGMVERFNRTLKEGFFSRQELSQHQLRGHRSYLHIRWEHLRDRPLDPCQEWECAVLASCRIGGRRRTSGTRGGLVRSCQQNDHA